MNRIVLNKCYTTYTQPDLSMNYIFEPQVLPLESAKMYQQQERKLELLSFPVHEKHLGLLERVRADIEQRFSVKIQVEETTYAHHDHKSGNHLRWVQLEGENIQLMRCAKAYITSLCSPEHQQKLEYPLDLHEDIEGKKEGLEHKYQYKAVVMIQQRGVAVVSGSMEEVLMVVSYLEDEINQWRLRLHDVSYVANREPQTVPSKQNPHEWIHDIPDSELVQTDASGRSRYPDLVPRADPHAVNTAPLAVNTAVGSQYQRTFQTRSHEASEHHHVRGNMLQSDKSKNSARTEDPFVQSQKEPMYQWRERNLQRETLTNDTRAHSQREPNGYKGVETDLPKEQTLNRDKPVHIATPPKGASLETKRQKTSGSFGQVLATDSVTNNKSSLGSSEPMSGSHSSGSFRSSSSFEFMSEAASRQGYSDQEVEAALKELPHDFKTSDLIMTLSRRRNRDVSSLHTNGASSQPSNSNPFDTSGRSVSPFSVPGPPSDPSSGKPQSSSQPLPLISISHKSPESNKGEMLGSPENRPFSSTKIATLRRRQQELLQSLASESPEKSPIGRLEVDSPPPDVMVHDHKSTTTAPITLPQKAVPSRFDNRTARQDDLMVLTQEHDMECIAAIEEAEKMEVDQEIQYINTTFPKGSERPDVVLLSPPKKQEPELVVIDDEDVKPDLHQVSRPSKSKSASDFKFDMPKTKKWNLAPNFRISDDSSSGGSKPSGSLPVISSVYSLSTTQHRKVKKIPYRTLGYSTINEAPRGIDEFDSLGLRSASPTELDEGENKNGSDVDQRRFDSSELALSSLNHEPGSHYRGDEEDENHRLQLETMDTEHNEPGLTEHEPGLREYEPGLRENETDLSATAANTRQRPRLKLRKVPQDEMQPLKWKDSGKNDDAQMLDISKSLPKVKQEPGITWMQPDDISQTYEEYVHDDEEFEEHYQSIKSERDLIKIENENDSIEEVTFNVKEDVQNLIKTFQADFDSQKEDFERKIREKTINETLNMVAEQNEAMQRKINEKQTVQENKDLTAQELEEKLRGEREKMKEELQKEMMEEMKRQIEQFKKQQIEQQQKQNQKAVAAGAGEKGAIVIKQSQRGTACPFRPIVVDGSNVAMLHGKRHGTFSCRGIALCVEYLQKMGVEDITVFVPRWRQSQDAARQDRKITNKEILDVLESRGILSFTPSRRVRGHYVNSYDDRFIVRLAVENDGVILSNDNYRDLMTESQEWRNVIETRLLMFTFAGDRFMIPDDPNGRNGPTLRELLLKPKTGAAQRGAYPAGQQTAVRQEAGALSAHQIEELTYNIGVEWESLGTYLRFSHSEINKIKHDHHRNTDGAIHKMLQTWSSRQTRNKANQLDVLAEALKIAGRADLAHMVLTWKRAAQQGLGGGGQAGHGVHTGQPGHGIQGGQAGILGPGPVGMGGQRPQQGYGGRPQQQHRNAPATVSKPPDEGEIDVKTLPQYKALKDMFPEKEADIVKLLKENPNSLPDYLVDKLLT